MSAASRRAGRGLSGAIRAYQALAAGRLSPCRFVPSCSTYALEAIEQHGPARGSWLAIRRVVRCRPFGGRGFDPVPG
ncbi:MAG TPA: membrane protein insertion efficiency factor YidD [Acidimicrobiales bacterium]|nr:membrane protein insertion efficiency factor YidD [Acidimicrobiales bacterium]